ncbi:MAG: hypothetical protein AB8B50_13925 [Pirellulaceae bacterium]
MSTTTISLPDASETQQFFSDLVGQNLPTTVLQDDFETFGVAIYADENGIPVGLIRCDLPGAARLGAVLTRIPRGAVDDCIKTRDFPEHIAENFDETLNIASNLFPNHVERRIALQESATGEKAADLLASVSIDEQYNFTLDITGYGTGCMGIARLNEAE